MTTAASQPVPRIARIGLWGAPQSGKTTFLAALQIAIVSQSNGGDWTIAGATSAASDFLSFNTSLMNRHHTFPSATTGVQELRWRFVSPAPPGRFWRRWLNRTDLPGQTVFEVELFDVSGGMFASVPNSSTSLAQMSVFAEEDGLDAFDDEPDEQNSNDQLLEHLARCDGLVYLFDPVRERSSQDAYDFFQRTLEQLTSRSYEMGRLRDGKLPHHLAVCVTKFDDPTVFRKAHHCGVALTGNDRAMTPKVPENLAGEFFRKLCSDRDAGSAALVHGSIERYFSSRRVGYFVSSSIGFYVGASGVFQKRDFSNVETTPSGEARIRGQVLPINVLEPFLWLEEQIRQSVPLP
ncbi:hypothetical protein [Frankia sp. Cppng1_Ct_nod]|uniref:hypothetical protein n=1 Tax=Frankia sp. Cppng1_Ct_nod TaxID=2897162 RepID=UPI0010413EB8|nr:hypothetical protein [Frankia sp. Cppng1_Ct_nod]